MLALGAQESRRREAHQDHLPAQGWRPPPNRRRRGAHHVLAIGIRIRGVVPAIGIAAARAGTRSGATALKRCFKRCSCLDLQMAWRMDLVDPGRSGAQAGRTRGGGPPEFRGAQAGQRRGIRRTNRSCPRRRSTRTMGRGGWITTPWAPVGYALQRIWHRGLATPTLGLRTHPATSSRGRQRKFRCNCIPPLQPNEPRLPLGLAPGIMRLPR